MTTATVKKATSKYTAEHVAAMREFAPLNLAKAKELAETELFKNAGITSRGIGAKCISEGIEYAKVEKTTKSGETVVDKADLAAEIAAILKVDGVETLAKADKAALRRVVEALKGFAS
jgi:hypothetical protein